MPAFERAKSRYDFRWLRPEECRMSVNRISASPNAIVLERWSKLAARLGPAARQALDETVQTLLSSPLLPFLWAKLVRDAIMQPGIGNVLNDPNLAFNDRAMSLFALMVGKMQEDIDQQAAIVKGAAGGAPTAIELQKLQRLVEQQNQMLQMLNSMIAAQGEAARNIARQM
jgi:hypothetical protein